MLDRPEIPAELRRAVLVEAGHRCAIPQCRSTELDVHHIEPWESCRSHEFGNLIALCPTCHRRAHKGEIDRNALLIYKNSLGSVVDHGVAQKGATVIINRSDGILHLLGVGGNIIIQATGWLRPIDKVVLRLSMAGNHAITWNGFASLPWWDDEGFRFTSNGIDILEFNHYAGDVHVTRVARSNSKMP